MEFYPHWHVLPDGRALMGGPGRSDSALDLSTYQFTDLPLLPEADGFGSGVPLLGPPSGLTTAFPGGRRSTPNTHRLNLLNPSAGWTNAAPSPRPGATNTVVLPDGTLLRWRQQLRAGEGSP